MTLAERARNAKRSKRSRRLKRAAQFLGAWAEIRVAWRLRLRGWRILARRWRGGGGEADIIATRGATLIFVEVKARTDKAALAYAWHVGQQRRLVRAARAFLAQSGAIPSHVRFDLVLATRWRLRYISHVMVLEKEI